MRILLLTHSYGTNGAAGLLLRAAVHWAKHMHWRVDALMTDGEYDKYSEKVRSVGINPCKSISMKTNRYDVGIVNTLLDLRFVGRLASSMPVILWVHEGKTVLLNWKSPVADVSRAFARASHIVFQTRWQSEEIFKSFLHTVSPSAISHILGGVETKNKPLKASFTLSDPVKIVCIGTVYQRKRQMDLVAVIDKLSATRHIECHIVGDYSQAGPWLDRIGADLKEQNAHIKWRGEITNPEELSRLILESDIACFPSGDETQSLSMLETGVHGLPVLASDLTPYRHIGWISGHNCILYPPGDLAQLQAHLENLMDDLELRNRLGINARHLVQTNFDIETFLKNITDQAISTAKKSGA